MLLGGVSGQYRAHCPGDKKPVSGEIKWEGDLEEDRPDHVTVELYRDGTKIDEIIESDSWRDAKSYFQELAQKQSGETPTYRTIKDEGPDHDKIFESVVKVNGKDMGRGIGKSKKISEMEAAKNALEHL